MPQGFQLLLAISVYLVQLPGVGVAAQVEWKWRQAKVPPDLVLLFIYVVVPTVVAVMRRDCTQLVRVAMLVFTVVFVPLMVALCGQVKTRSC